MKFSLSIAACLMAFLCLCVPASCRAQEALPEAVQAYVDAPLMKVGSGIYRKFGFRIYQATLWAPNGVWSDMEPCALELRYARSLSKDTLADAIVGDIRDQNVADDETLARWTVWIDQTLPAVKEGDTMIGLKIPGAESVLFFNGTERAKFKDEAMSQAFFNIWLGDQADEDLRAALLKTASD